jgi:hypothetical protein
MKSKLLAALVLCVYSGFLAAAQDGNQLLSQCKTALLIGDPENHLFDETKSIDAGFCMGLMWGFLDLNSRYEGFLKHTPIAPIFCIPDGVTIRQLMAVAVKSLEASPEALHESGGLLATYAFMDAFPCQDPT